MYGYRTPSAGSDDVVRDLSILFLKIYRQGEALVVMCMCCEHYIGLNAGLGAGIFHVAGHDVTGGMTAVTKRRVMDREDQRLSRTAVSGFLDGFGGFNQPVLLTLADLRAGNKTGSFADVGKESDDICEGSVEPPVDTRPFSCPVSPTV